MLPHGKLADERAHERQSPARSVKQTAETDYPHRYTEIALRALSEENSDELLANLLNIQDSPPQLRQIVLAKTGGNPFYVEEFTRTLIDTGALVRSNGDLHWNSEARIDDIPIPENLQALLTARIDRLEEGARRTLQLGSVIGRSFYDRVLRLISDSNIALDKELNTLQRAELIREALRGATDRGASGHWDQPVLGVLAPTGYRPSHWDACIQRRHLHASW